MTGDQAPELVLACRACGARPGYGCVTHRGRSCQQSHARRRDDARELGALAFLAAAVVLAPRIAAEIQAVHDVMAEAMAALRGEQLALFSGDPADRFDHRADELPGKVHCEPAADHAGNGGDE